ncbi:FecR family protein [Phenylobacterium sp.]|uniref:FecR family protein n=1 Tax=Phenylobacterium sp. TaxID=1871053 RepID=UPI0025DEBC33|nr:FecR family protein [Phenylobacterium sp.]
MRATITIGLLMAAVLSTPSWAAGEAKPVSIGRVKSVMGTAYIIRGQAPKTPVKPTPDQIAKPGQVLLQSDMIQTGKDGSLGITFADNSRFAVGPNTNLVLSQFEFDNTTHRGRFLTTVNKGTVAINSGQIAHENKDAMKVRTPVSLLAARGTRFVVEVP